MLHDRIPRTVRWFECGSVSRRRLEEILPDRSENDAAEKRHDPGQPEVSDERAELLREATDGTRRKVKE